MEKDYYKILGIDRTANCNEIKNAYRDLALKYHPDKNKSIDGEIYFMEIAEAYEVLKDKISRDYYDKYGIGYFRDDKNEETFIFHGNPLETFNIFIKKIALWCTVNLSVCFGMAKSENSFGIKSSDYDFTSSNCGTNSTNDIK